MKRWLIGGVGLVSVLIAFWHYSADRAPRKRGPAGAAVRAVPVQRRNMPVVEHTIGTVVSPTTVQVTARVQGVLDKVFFKEGQFVKKGDLLFQIDPRGFAATLAQAQAMLMRDEAQLNNGSRDLQRYVELSATNSTSAQLLDTARSNVQVLTATVAADKAAVRMAELNLDYAQIRSPINGKTGPLLIQPGNMISATGTAPLVVIVQLQPIKVSFTLSQTELPRIQARQRTSQLLASLDGRTEGGGPLVAPVDFTDNSVNNQTGTIELRATFPNSDLSLVPGQLLNVTVVLDDIPDALVVPRDAVNDGPDGAYVYAVETGKAVVHRIRVLFEDAQAVAVDGDIHAGDAVITEGQLQVTADGPVRVISSEPNPPAAHGARKSSGDKNQDTRQLPLDPQVNLSRLFIDRPIMTILVMAAFVVFGIFGYLTLPVSELPNIEFPTINVGANLPGADPETMASAVATPLESAFANVPGVDTMTSSSTQGSTNITLQFRLDRNIDSAAEDVEAAIEGILRRLPRAMPAPPTFRKIDPSAVPVFFIAVYSDSLPISKVDQYARTILANQLSTLDGVAQVTLRGQARYAVRIQADPAAMAARQLGLSDLANAAALTNTDQASGVLNGSTKTAIIRANGQLENAESFQRQIITYRNGAPVRFSDVANVVDSLENVRSMDWLNHRRAVTLAIQQQPGSNTVAVVDNIRRVLPRLESQLPPALKMQVFYDRSQTIRAAVDNVQTTLLIAAALVVAVIFLFLRRPSATLIPSLALPIAVIGTFGVMSLLRYSLDNLSLMALTLAVGFVVDDAIVMLENIVRHIEGGTKPYDAAVTGSAEISFTILSITLSLAAVFIPIVFMGGIVGRLLHEFAVTVVVAILISGIVSITLTPMLCDRLLKDERERTHTAFYRHSEAAFERLRNFYDRTLRWSLAHPRTIMGAFFASIALGALMVWIMPQDFMPGDDTGQLHGTVQTATGTAYDQNLIYVRQVSDIIERDPNVESVEADEGGDITIALKPLSLGRPSANEVANELRAKVRDIPGTAVTIANPPIIRVGARGSRSNYQYTLQGLSIADLESTATKLVQALQSDPTFVGVNSDHDLDSPAVQVDIDRSRAAAYGITPDQIEQVMGVAFGGQQVSQIYAATDQYQVVLELLPQYQLDASALSRLYLTGANSAMVPLGTVANIRRSTMAQTINHSGQIPSITVSFDLSPGKALSDAVAGVTKATEQIGFPPSVEGYFAGTVAAFQSSTSNMVALLVIALLVVYIILGILYESFVHPLTILSGLPSAALGALLTLYVAHVPLTLYAFVGMIMLIGIVKKNAIMMVDFALARTRADQSVSASQAVYEAALIRFRPIMMTTMAAMMGTLPIAFGTGMGAESRRPLGLCVAGGLLLSQALTLYITPVIYVYLDRLARRFDLRSGEAAAAASPG